MAPQAGLALRAAGRDEPEARLRARGGFDVDLEWQDARLERAEITSRIGSTCREFATTAGARYVLVAER